MELGN